MQAASPTVVWRDLLRQSWHERPCPICQAEQTTLLYQGDRHNLWLHNVICHRCGHIYVNPAPTEAWLQRFYEQVYRPLYNTATKPDAAYLQQHDPEKLGIRRCMEWLAQHLDSPAPLTVVDIGCAEGTYLAELERLRPIQAIAFEPAAEFAIYARDRLPQATIYTEPFSVERLVTAGIQADVVIAAHVLEHVLGPAAFLQQIRTILASDGILYLEVPVGDRDKVKNIFHVAHLNHFTHSSLPILLECNGFKLQHMDRKGTRGGAGGAYRLLARPTDGTVSATARKHMMMMARPVIARQIKKFRFYRWRIWPRWMASRLFGVSPASLLMEEEC